jgi:hypothetical protein
MIPAVILALHEGAGYSQTHLLMDIQLPEDFGGVQQMLVLEDPVMCQSLKLRWCRANGLSSLLCIERQQGQIQKQGYPVSVDQEQESQECVYGGFWDDVGVQAVAKIDRIDIVTVGQRSASLDQWAS